jgi:Protein of unknown function (DUF551).
MKNELGIEICCENCCECFDRHYNTGLICRELGGDGEGIFDPLPRAFKARIKELQAERDPSPCSAGTKWIPIHEKLPPTDRWILIWLPGRPWDYSGDGKGFRCKVVRYSESDAEFDEFGPGSYSLDEISHWADFDEAPALLGSEATSEK